MLKTILIIVISVTIFGVLFFLYVKNQSGKIILRIEDTDQSRKIQGAVKNLTSS